MSSDDRFPWWTIGMSIMLHALLMSGLQQVAWTSARPESPSVTRYVVQFRQPTPMPAPTMTPIETLDQSPMAPAPPEPPMQPQTPQTVTPAAVDLEPTAMPEAPMTEVIPTPIKTASVPTLTQPQAFKTMTRTPIDRKPLPVPALSPTPVSPIARTLPEVEPRRPQVMSKLKPKPPRSKPRQPVRAIPRQARTQTAAVIPRTVQPVNTRIAKLEPPRKPVVDWQPAAPPPSQAAVSDSDALRDYLSLILATLEKHKRYPKYAKRRAMNGRVVLQFVVLPDGEVVDPQIAESDGHKSFRTAALHALRRAGQMPPFPSDIRRRQLLVEVPIAYQMKKR